ncbi:MAG: hypothetical protein JW982_02130 [Spirochaetes bacterium]|nr:hypothetical protein [Spirochaetota bacterium]
MITKMTCQFHFKNIFSENISSAYCIIVAEIEISLKYPFRYFMPLAAVPGANYSLTLNGTAQKPVNPDKLSAENSESVTYPKFEFYIPEGNSTLKFATVMPSGTRKQSSDLHKQIYTFFHDFSPLKTLQFYQNSDLSLIISADYKDTLLKSLLFGKPVFVIGSKSRDEEKGITIPVKTQYRRDFMQTIIKPQFSLPDMISINIGRKNIF